MPIFKRSVKIKTKEQSVRLYPRKIGSKLKNQLELKALKVKLLKEGWFTIDHVIEFCEDLDQSTLLMIDGKFPKWQFQSKLESTNFTFLNGLPQILNLLEDVDPLVVMKWLISESKGQSQLELLRKGQLEEVIQNASSLKV
ncbi:MAG: hypothetical protein ACRCXZ_02875 [Patescibacteria group bacterium]